MENAIGSVVLGEQSPGYAAEFLGIAAAGIKRVSFTPNNFNDFVAFDDLRFVSNAVPEPGTVALLGLGLAGLGFRRGKRA